VQLNICRIDKHYVLEPFKSLVQPAGKEVYRSDTDHPGYAGRIGLESGIVFFKSLIALAEFLVKSPTRIYMEGRPEGRSKPVKVLKPVRSFPAFSLLIKTFREIDHCRRGPERFFIIERGLS